MIHSSETIDKIKELLILSGVSNDERLEEMIDHYLCDIEIKIMNSQNPQEAIRTTFQEIANTDFKFLQEDNSKRNKIGLALLFLLILASMIFFLYPSNSNVVVAECIELEAPDGWPLPNETAAITSHFGMRKHPKLKSNVLHNGVDIKASIGTPVLATGPATVKKVGYSERAGKYIILEHNDRFSTKYYHLSSIHVAENEIIHEGSIIGEVGTTGSSFGPHLHYEILDNEKPIDPLLAAIL